MFTDNTSFLGVDSKYKDPVWDGSNPDFIWLSQVVGDFQGWLEDQSCHEATSQLTGGGAIREAERLFSSIMDGRPSLMVPSATSGMLIALKAVGVCPGSEVILPAFDWGSSLATVSTLGATPVVAPNNNGAAARHEECLTLVTDKTKAVIVSHIWQVVDARAIRKALPAHIPVIEDCSRAFGCRMDGYLAGTLADLAVFSFGPGKEPLDVGEGGMIVARDWELWERLVAVGAHPIRQITAGLPEENPASLSFRPHPLSAILLVIALRRLAEFQPELSRPATEKDARDCRPGSTYDIASVIEKMG